MTSSHALRPLLTAMLVAVAGALALPAVAQTAAPAPAAKPAAKPKAVKSPSYPVVTEIFIPDAAPEQVKAAEMVYMGHYDCEFSQSIDIGENTKHSAYVDLKHGKSAWLMKPVLSSTGAIRLEDVKGETLMVQIASKSMLLNVKTGRRIVDDCISPKQHELIEAAKAAKIAGS